VNLGEPPLRNRPHGILMTAHTSVTLWATCATAIGAYKFCHPLRSRVGVLEDCRRPRGQKNVTLALVLALTRSGLGLGLDALSSTVWPPITCNLCPLCNNFTVCFIHDVLSSINVQSWSTWICSSNFQYGEDRWEWNSGLDAASSFI